MDPYICVRQYFCGARPGKKQGLALGFDRPVRNKNGWSRDPRPVFFPLAHISSRASGIRANEPGRILCSELPKTSHPSSGNDGIKRGETARAIDTGRGWEIVAQYSRERIDCPIACWLIDMQSPNRSISRLHIRNFFFLVPCLSPQMFPVLEKRRGPYLQIRKVA